MIQCIFGPNTTKMNFKTYSFFIIFGLLLSSEMVKSQSLVPEYATITESCSQQNILNNLTEYEALGVKFRGTAALQNTLDWLKNKYWSYGYSASQIQEDPYNYNDSTCKNLIVTKIGTLYPDVFVIVDGHYDSVNGTGTNDNGSGVATILEMARLLQNVPTEYSIKFINFSGEEEGLYGSSHYVDNVVNATSPKMNIRVLLNIDEVGGVAGEINNTITCERDQSQPTANNSQSNSFAGQMRNCFRLYSPLETVSGPVYSSDYVPFQRNGEIVVGIFETNETPFSHSENDLLVNMDPVYVYNVTKGATGTILHFAKALTSNLETEIFDADFQISLYPNPTKNELFINKGNLSENHYTFKIIDLFGKVVLNESFANANLIENITVSHLPKGLYLGIIQTANKKITKKILID